jgi:hypothetical protein
MRTWDGCMPRRDLSQMDVSARRLLVCMPKRSYCGGVHAYEVLLPEMCMPKRSYCKGVHAYKRT